MSDSVRPHRRQPIRLPHPWDSPGKNTGVGCHFLLQCMKVKSENEVAQSCPALSDPMDCSPPGSSVHGIFQARVLEWGAIAFSTPTEFLFSVFLFWIAYLIFKPGILRYANAFFPLNMCIQDMYMWGFKSQQKGVTTSACLSFPSSFDDTCSFFDSLSVRVFDVSVQALPTL